MTQQIPCITIYSEREGYLNARARRILFAGRSSGYVSYDLTVRPLSIAPAPDHLGWRVGPEGHVNTRPITQLTGTWPLIFRLEPHPEHPRLLLFAENITPIKETPNGNNNTPSE